MDGFILKRKLETMKKDAKQDIRKSYLRPTLHAKVIKFGVFGSYGGYDHGGDDDDDGCGGRGGRGGWR